jgi:hypothetical protein
VTPPFDLEEIASAEVKQASFVEMLQDVCDYSYKARSRINNQTIRNCDYSYKASEAYIP